jgi:hypothetical protein
LAHAFCPQSGHVNFVLQPQIGQTFESGEENVAVISHRYWKRRFAGDLSVLGRSIAINGVPYTVIGVTPPEFFGPVAGLGLT